VLLVARLFMAGEIKLLLEGSDLDPASAADPLTKSARFKQVSILKRKTADATTLRRARELYKDLFSQLGRDEEDSLVADFRTRLGDWQTDLKSYALTAATPHHPGKTTIDTALARIGQQLAIRDSFAFIEALLSAKDDWQDAAEDIHDLINFYKTQITAWRKLLAALAQFSDNREALNKVPQAATALAELTLIRDNPQPYGQVNRIEPLVASVHTVNEQLAQDKREKALLSIDSKLAVVQKQLHATAAAPELCNKALKPLQDLKTRIAGLSSIAQILYLQGQGDEAMDDAITLIEAAAAKPAPVVASPGDAAKPVQTGQPNVPAPAPKTTRVVRAAEFSNQPYLETEADVDAYLMRLKSELLAVVRAGQKARVQ